MSERQGAPRIVAARRFDPGAAGAQAKVVRAGRRPRARLNDRLLRRPVEASPARLARYHAARERAIM
jgi:hypothetical protein